MVRRVFVGGLNRRRDEWVVYRLGIYRFRDIGMYWVLKESLVVC